MYSITYLNLICTDLGVTSSHKYEIDALNAICIGIGGTGGHKYTINALNEICTLQSVTSGHKYNISALNAIASGAYKYENDAWKYIQVAAVLNPFWVSNPYFALPTKGLQFIAGESSTIYGDSLINVPFDSNLVVEYTCAIGTQSGNNFVLSPTIAQIGDYPLQITFKNGSALVGTFTISINVHDRVPVGSFSVLGIGDSTMDADIEVIGAKAESILTNNTITYIGTTGTTRKCEAYPGWGIADFITDHAAPVSPFMKAGVLDLAAYLTDNSLATPDKVNIRVGINGVFGYATADYTTETFPAIIADQIADFKTLIDAWLALNATTLIDVSLPTICTSSDAMFHASYDQFGVDYFQHDKYVQFMHMFWQQLVLEFANGAYSNRVDCSYEAICLNRATGYENALHLNTTGNQQLGTGLAPYMMPKKVIINSQVWDLASLDITVTAMGTVIPEVTDNSTWASLTTPAWAWHTNDSANNKFGKLYNRYAVLLIQSDIDAYNAANPTTPYGRKVPPKTDYDALETFLGGSAVAGKAMRLVDSVNAWWYLDSGATNVSRFNAIGSAIRLETGAFSILTKWNFLAHINTNICRALNATDDAIRASNYYRTENDKIGVSIRLIHT